MAEFHQLDVRVNARANIWIICGVFFVLLFFHALLEYSDVWVTSHEAFSIGLQIQKQLALQANTNTQRAVTQVDEQQQQKNQQQQKQQQKQKQKQTVVVYTGPTSLDRSTGKNELYLRNFDYFLAHKGVDCSMHDTIITLSEETYNYYMKDDGNSRLIQLMQECNNDSLKVLKRQDVCYDLGSIHLVLNTFDLTKYDYFVYLNCGVVGPLWWDVPSVSWTTFFTSLLTDQIKMSGLSTNCQYSGDYQAHIQSMAFALDRTGLEIVRASDAIYDCGMENAVMREEDKLDLIGRYELGMTRAIFAQGYSISSWLWSRGRDGTRGRGKTNNNSNPGGGKVHEPVVIHSSYHQCYTVWQVDQFLIVSSNYPRHHPSWNLTFFKTSRFIPPDVLDEVGYELTNQPMQDLVTDYSKGLTSRFWAFQMMQSVFVE